MRGYGFGIGSMLVGMRGSEASGVVNQVGLILDLDASNPLSYPGSGTAWSDLTANNNDFILVNGPTFSAEKGGSIVTDGINDYAESVAAVSETNAGVSAFIYMKCTKLNNASSGGFWYVWLDNKRQASGVRGYQIYITASGADYTTYGYLSPVVSVGNAAGSADAGVVDGWSQTTVPPIEEDQWYYIGFTTGGLSGNTLTMYVNGLAVGSTTLSGDRRIDTQDIRIGSTGWSNVFGLQGNVKNKHLYSRELSATEVLSNYNAIK
jgi:hypothetical protein